MNRTPKTRLIAATATAFLAFAIPSLAQTQPATPPTAHPATPPAGVDPATHAAHLKQAPAAADTNSELVNQIAALRAEVAKLQAALTQGHTAQAPASTAAGMGMGGMSTMQRPMSGGQMQPMQPRPTSGMGGMPSTSGGMAGMSGAGGMGMDQMMMGGMGGGSSGAGMSGMSGGGSGMGMMDMDGMMKMMGMGNMPMGGAGSPAAMVMPSALAGFPGASHIYHVGATGFFLDHTGHITLTFEQQTLLNQRKEQVLLEQADFRRKIEQAEQELWVLTAADQPDAAAIERKVQEIAKLQGDQRLAFIRAVGEAAKVLTEEQRKQLTGMLPPAPTPASMPGM